MTRVTTIAAALLLLGVGAAGAPHAETPDDHSSWKVASVEEGRRIFQAVCSGCHGARGDGAGRAAKGMFPPPRDLTRGEYRFRSTASGALPLRSDLMRTLERGLTGTMMPGWSDQLSAHELRSVVVYLETLSERFQEEQRWEEDVRVDPERVEPPDPTPELLERGRGIYEEMKCGDCHGADGQGDGPSAPTLENSDGSESHVFDFTYGVYKGGKDPLHVYRTFLTGLDGTPMPAYDQSLPEEAGRWALVYYVLSLGRERGLWYYLSNRPTWEEPSAPAAEPAQ